MTTEIQTRLDSIRAEIAHYQNEHDTYQNPGCYNAAWCAGFVDGASKVLSVLESPDKIYAAVKLANRAEDAKDFIADYFSDNCSGEAEARACYAHAMCCRDDIAIAKQFIDNHDCNVSDNARFEAVVRNFYRNKK